MPGVALSGHDCGLTGRPARPTYDGAMADGTDSGSLAMGDVDGAGGRRNGFVLLDLDESENLTGVA